MEIFQCILSVHDFFFYASRTFAITVTAPFINNTALLYALNTHIPSVHRIITGSTPRYVEDRKKFEVYATPAHLEEIAPSIGGKSIDWQNGGEKIKVTYNAVNSPLLFKMKKEKIAIPKTGAYSKYTPLTTFQFFTLGGKGSGVIRVGKKLSTARVKYELLQDIEKHKGIFQPTHPVNPIDLPEETSIIEGTVHNLPPMPLLTDVKLEGTYYTGTLRGRELCIARPDLTQYTSVV